MRIKQYFCFLVMSSVICFLFLVLHSRLLEHPMLQGPHQVLQRYTKHLWRPSNGYDQFSHEESENNQDNFQDLQELVQKLMNDSVTKENTRKTNVLQNQDDVKRCKPEINIVFLKTHKTGSSTLTNIFNRFADLRELRVALPLQGFNRFRWPMKFHWTAADLFLLGTNYANILCNHARYSREAMDSIMELDSKYVTILRNPIKQFESTFDYMEFSKDFGLENFTDPMRRFLRKPFDHIRNLTRRRKSISDSMNLLRNGMFFDLGMDHGIYNNRTLILNAIKKLDEEFFLVMIMEYFDESLVLLKRELCWELEDIVYAKFNQRHRVKKEKMDYSLKKMIERWNGADVLLYRHFNKTFWKKVKSHGPAFYKDLEEFRRKNREVQRECLSTDLATAKAVGLTMDVKKLQLNPVVTSFDRYFCEKVITEEVDYLKYFRLKFNPYFGYQKRMRIEHSRQLQYITNPVPRHQYVQMPRQTIPPRGQRVQQRRSQSTEDRLNQLRVPYPQFVRIPPKRTNRND